MVTHREFSEPVACLPWWDVDCYILGPSKLTPVSAGLEVSRLSSLSIILGNGRSFGSFLQTNNSVFLRSAISS